MDIIQHVQKKLIDMNERGAYKSKAREREIFNVENDTVSVLVSQQ